MIVFDISTAFIGWFLKQKGYLACSLVLKLLCAVLNQVTVLYFAKSAELTGVRSERLRVNPELTSLQLWQQLEHKHPK